MDLMADEPPSGADVVAELKAAGDLDRLFARIDAGEIELTGSGGLIPELIGRFPSLTYLEPLNAKSLKRILSEPKNALVKQYVKLFEIDGIKLSFEGEVLDFIVDKAIEFKLGARGLRSICEAILTDAMFELPSNTDKEFKLTLEYAKEQFSKSKVARLKVA